MTATLEHVTGIIARYLKRKPWTLKADELLTDMGLDAIDLIEVAFAIEDWFGVEIHDEDIEEIKTVNDAVRLVDKLMERRNGAQTQG